MFKNNNSIRRRIKPSGERERRRTMEEYKIGNATVRIHGTVNKEKVETATTEFLKEVERRKKKAKKQEVEKGA